MQSIVAGKLNFLDKMSATNLSILATFDDLRRCIQVLTDGSAEEELLKILQLQKKMQLECISRAQEAQRIQKELDASLQSMADLETKLFHARRLLEMESKARKEAEHDRDQMEKKLVAVADLLQHENNLKNETRDKLGFLHTLPRKRKSVNRNLEEKYGNEINSTGSFLSDLSITQSEDDFLEDRPSRSWHKNKQFNANNGGLAIGGNKRTRLCDENVETPPAPQQQSVRRSTRRSKTSIQQSQQHNMDVLNGTERICATTKVTIPQDGNGAIRAESTIETVPVVVHKEDININEAQSSSTPCRSPLKQSNGQGINIVTMSMDSPVTQHIKSGGTLKRAHNFVSKTFIRGETCIHCQRK